jgi:hypothetical protein
MQLSAISLMALDAYRSRQYYKQITATMQHSAQCTVLVEQQVILLVCWSYDPAAFVYARHISKL